VDRQPQSALDDRGLVPKAWAATSQAMSRAAALGVARRHARLDDTRAGPAVAKIAAQRQRRPGKGPPEPAQDGTRVDRQPQSTLDDRGLVPKAWAAASQAMSRAAALGGVARRHARLDDTRAGPPVAKIAAQRRRRPGKGPPEPAQDDKREERRAFVRFGERPRSPEEQTRFGLGDKQADSEGAARFSCLNGRGHSA
jgi:hypothetical protein